MTSFVVLRSDPKILSHVVNVLYDIVYTFCLQGRFNIKYDLHIKHVICVDRESFKLTVQK